MADLLILNVLASQGRKVVFGVQKALSDLDLNVETKLYVSDSYTCMCLQF